MSCKFGIAYGTVRQNLVKKSMHLWYLRGPALGENTPYNDIRSPEILVASLVDFEIRTPKYRSAENLVDSV
jgi:hypothetical protein